MNAGSEFNEASSNTVVVGAAVGGVLMFLALLVVVVVAVVLRQRRKRSGSAPMTTTVAGPDGDRAWDAVVDGNDSDDDDMYTSGTGDDRRASGLRWMRTTAGGHLDYQHLELNLPETPEVFTPKKIPVDHDHMSPLNNQRIFARRNPSYPIHVVGSPASLASPASPTIWDVVPPATSPLQSPTIRAIPRRVEFDKKAAWSDPYVASFALSPPRQFKENGSAASQPGPTAIHSTTLFEHAEFDEAGTGFDTSAGNLSRGQWMFLARKMTEDFDEDSDMFRDYTVC